MRIPDLVRRCVCFLCTESTVANEQKLLHFGGTAFLISLPSERAGFDFIYLVTAKHCITEAGNRTLKARFNLKSGGSIVVDLNGVWFKHPDPSIDIAVMQMSPPDGIEVGYLPWDMFDNANVPADPAIGIGDDVLAVGLFTQHTGRSRNIPIVRSGIIAAMPEEKIIDRKYGVDYDAYLVELRSIGGLSGSPVFVYLAPSVLVDKDGKCRGIRVKEPSLYLLGLIRGHWDIKATEPATDFGGDISDKLNVGIATVTPVYGLMEILMSNPLKEFRQRQEQEAAEATAPTNDSAFDDDAEGVRSENFTKRNLKTH
jgi:hypothetical protein